MKPFLKWIGGKRLISETIIGMFPTEFGTYYEPFLGGGSILFETCPVCAVVGDRNRWLIDTYRAVATNPDTVMSHLDGMENSEPEFKRIRSIDPDSLDDYHRAAQMIYLNKTCFRGLFRVNQKGRFNVPYGEYDRRYYDRENILAVAGYLVKVDIRCGDFEANILGSKPSDFVYMDPPYYKQGGYSDFNRYTSDKFIWSDYLRLVTACRQMDERGVKWGMSNSDTPFVREMFKDWKMTWVEARREINLDSSNREISELFVSNY